MDDAITRQLEADLAALRAQLEDLDIVKDIQALERIIRLRKGNLGRKPVAVMVERPAASGRQMAATSISMKDAVERLLRDKSEPVLTKDLHDALASEGIQVPGDNPQNNLSAHLSRDSRFVSFGREGWVLATHVSPNEVGVKHVVEQYVASMASEEVEEISALLDSSDAIPAELDQELLRLARSALGRNLVEAEKRLLRSAFKDSVHMRALIG